MSKVAKTIPNMATKDSTIQFLLDQLRGIEVSARKMFGEYGLYCDSRIVGLICDDQLFIKPTENGKKLIKDLVEKPAYSGAKPYFWISDELWEESEWLKKLVKTTADALPRK